MKITLVTVGKIKERYFEDAIKEYSKRLGRYCRLDIIQVQDEKTPDGAGEAMERQIKDKEGPVSYTHLDVYKRQNSRQVRLPFFLWALAC